MGASTETTLEYFPIPTQRSSPHFDFSTQRKQAESLKFQYFPKRIATA